MLAVIACLAGITLILVAAEAFWRKKILRGEYQRKFVHILAGTFIAFWPWIISFRQIQVISLVMLGAIIIVQRYKLMHFTQEPKRAGYGFVFFAMGILITSTLTDNNVIFALAVLNMSLADGIAAIVGEKFGKDWHYMILTHTKTVLGSMAFWLTSLCIFGFGVLFSPTLANHYAGILLFLPPLLLIAENLPGLGADNIFVPVLTVVILDVLTRI